jgi:hypothetical protein
LCAPLLTNSARERPSSFGKKKKNHGSFELGFAFSINVVTYMKKSLEHNLSLKKKMTVNLKKTMENKIWG